MGKNERLVKTFLGLQNGAIRGMQIGAREITNKGSFRDFKSRQNDYKSGQRFQIGAKRFQIDAEITNRAKRNFESGQRLQISAEHLDH